MARKEGFTSIDIPATLRDRLNSTAKDKGITRDELIAMMLDNLDSISETETLPESESVKEAIAQGAKKNALIQSGMEWAAKMFLSQRKSKEESGVKISELSDVELETLDPKISKQIGGVAEVKLSRMIDKLEAWNDAHANDKDRMIFINPSYLMSLRDEMSKLTGGKITGLNRNQVFAYFNQAGSAITPRGLGQAHNRKIFAIPFGIQAHQDLILQLLDSEQTKQFSHHLSV